MAGDPTEATADLNDTMADGAAAAAAAASTSAITRLLTQFQVDLSAFVAGLATDPLVTIQEMPHMVVILFLAPALIIWVIRQLTAPTQGISSNQLKQRLDDSFEDPEVEQIKKEAKEASKSAAVWQIGVSGKSVSVSEEGVLLAFEFSKDRKLPTADEIVFAFLKAAAKPMEPGVKPHLPEVAMVLSTRMVSDKAVAEAAAKLKDLVSVRVDTQEALEPELKELMDKRRAEVEKNKPAMPVAQPPPKPSMQPPPNRACFVCKKDIEGKPRQCSACKAIIYCSADCATKDWPQHKIMCSTYKGNMAHLTDLKLHDLPFTFYNSKKQLENFNQVAFLVDNNVHNVGVYRRLCQCFSKLQWGELSGELAAQMAQEQFKEDPEKQFELTGLPKELYPLGKPFKAGVDVNKIDSWEAWYKAVGIPMSSPVALVYEVTLTLWYIIKNFAPIRTENGRRQLTLHLLGPEREADLIHTLPSLLSFLPKTDIIIHMVGPNLSKRLMPEHVAYNFAANDSTLFVSLRSEEYGPMHYDGSLFGIDKKTRGASPPDLVLILNATVFQFPSYFMTMKLLVEKGQKTIFTEPIETSIEILSKQLQPMGVGLTVEPRPNPFRQPVFQWKKEVNLPGWSNGFLTGMGKF